MDEHRAAFEYDLIRLGLRLRDLGESWFTWEDLKAITLGLQADPGSLLAREIHGPEAIAWDLQAQLLAAVFDSLQWLEFRERQQLFKDPGDPPEPLQRPGIKSKKQQWTGAPRTIEEMDSLLGWNQN